MAIELQDVLTDGQVLGRDSDDTPGGVSLAVAVTAYGAVGNGTTDDLAALQAANDAVEAAGGGSVLVPEGTFKVTAPFVLGDGVSLVGQGPNSIIKGIYAAAGQQCVIKNDWTNGNTRIAIRNLRIDRSGANAEHGILLNGVTGLLIEGVEVSGAAAVTSGAISISGIGPATQLVSTDVRVVGCHLANCDNFGVQLGFVNRAVVSGCTIDAFREAVGVEPETGDTAQDIAIIGNTITTPATGGGTETGVIVATESSGGTISGITIEGNTVRSTDTTPTATTLPGIVVFGADNAIVKGNLVVDIPGLGIQIGNATYAVDGAVVVGNMVVACNRGANLTPAGAGIGLRNADHVIVAANYVKGSAHTHSVEETSGAANNIIQGNILLDTTKYGTVGAGTLIYGNKEVDAETSFLFGGGVASPFIAINGTASVRDIRWQTGGSLRWIFRVNATAESGSNAGSDIEILARTDAGGSLGTALEIIRSSLKVRTGGELEIDGALNHDGTTVGFYGTAPAVKPTVTGSRGGNAALASLLTALAGQGLLTDSSSA